MGPPLVLGRPWLRALVGIGVSLVCLALVLREAHPAEALAALASVDPTPVGLAALLGLVNVLARGWRWQTLVAGVGHAPYWRTFASLMVGYLVNNLAPLRTGELARVYLLHRATAVSRGSLLATVVVERTLDGLFLVVCLALLVRFLDFPEWAYRAGLAVGLVFSTLALALALVSSRRFNHLVRGSLLERLPVRLAAPGAQLWERVGIGAAVVRRPRRGALVLWQTAAIWALEAGAAYLALRALGLDLPPLAAALLTVSIGLGSAIPSGPSAVGTYEFLVVSSLAIFGVDAAPALALAALLHGLAFAETNLIGLLALAFGSTVGWRAAVRPERLAVPDGEADARGSVPLG